MAHPKTLIVTIHLGQVDSAREPQEVAKLLRALAGMVDSSGHYPDTLRDREGEPVLETKLN